MNDSPATLTRIGYWSGGLHNERWPSPADFVDLEWDVDEREQIVRYLKQGVGIWFFGGASTCRMCGTPNGAVELTDGTFAWPDGLSHYVEDHGVRLPSRFVDYVLGRIESLEQAEYDEDWWSGFQE